LGFQPVSLGTKSITDLEATIPFSSPLITIQPAEDAFTSVTSYAGASLKRDAVDSRVIGNILNGTVSCTTGSNGSTGGFIDSQKDVGGWPVYTYEVAAVPVDTDGDGIPDSWETSHGLNPTNPADGITTTLDGAYTNVEVYLYSLVKSITDNQTAGSLSGLFPPVNTNSTKISAVYHASSSQVEITSLLPLKRIYVHDLHGKLIKTITCSDRKILLDVSGIPVSVYVLSALADDSTLSSLKIELY